ncbi:hypothetical protein EPUS_00029 [Endocarpon pusillum Z07020]|uniref:Uncharacterized protein n=1 Tax=Endocarpon pusillum (strain Z07020 / HMAS-L-300199) TaxID=1263415 RepID=U1GCD2_ENDPU|nr:uncharacterized protein EPUS_00029 [Endocarpon pusillum Z07020]ERF75237.1 hypothetical protein EPUS_00029 [Endocarpon pusillum Z07020]
MSNNDELSGSPLASNDLMDLVKRVVSDQASDIEQQQFAAQVVYNRAFRQDVRDILKRSNSSPMEIYPDRSTSQAVATPTAPMKPSRPTLAERAFSAGLPDIHSKARAGAQSFRRAGSAGPLGSSRSTTFPAQQGESMPPKPASEGRSANQGRKVSRPQLEQPNP